MSPRGLRRLVVGIDEDSTAAEALECAQRAVSRPPSWKNLTLNLFCDGSLRPTSQNGAFSVVFPPWLPSKTGASQDELTERAWPVHPMPDSNMAEMMSIAEGVGTAI